MNAKSQAVKCVVCDLDHTLWDGILSEDTEVNLRPGAYEAIRTLDERGILQSIASRNDHGHAMSRLESLGLAEYFLYPQIHWKSKVPSMEAIAKSLNIGLDSLAFVDNDAFERGQVTFAHPGIACFEPADLTALVSLPEFTPQMVTEDARARRGMYMSERARAKAEESFDGPQEAFLATLGMVLTVAPARLEDLDRAGELMVRTHQLNTTGYSYSQEELLDMLSASERRLLMASLEDRYGSYGKVGLALIEIGPTAWTIKLLLMSCRVAARGAGSLLIQHIRRAAKESNVRLLAEFVPNDRNRQMYITYKFSGFREIEKCGLVVMLEDSQTSIPPLPDYVKLIVHS